VRDAGTGHGSAAGRSRARQGRSRYPWLLRVFWLWRDKGVAYVLRRTWLRARGPRQYDPDWIRAHDALSRADLAAIGRRMDALKRPPLFSIILTVAAEPARTQAAIDAVRAQIYDRWELYLIGAATAAIPEGLHGDPTGNRIRLDLLGREDVSAAAHDALAQAVGEFVIRLGCDGRIASHALYLLAEAIDADPDANIIYGDEDDIDEQGRRSNPQFKTDWNPDLLLSQSYFGSVVAYRAERVREAGGFRAGFAGAEDYDLALRVIERVAGSTIRHVPFLLYQRYAVHLRTGPAVAQSGYATSARRALEEHLARTGTAATVEVGSEAGIFRVRRKLPVTPPRVSLIMPTRDGADLLKGAVESILARTDYPDYEIVVVDNGSTQPDALAYLANLERQPRIRVLRYDRPFNFSAINNFAARQCTSPILGLLNNDVVVIGAGWLAELVSHAVRPEVGAVGAMLYYPDDTIQHAGIIVGYGGAAINCYGGVPRGSGGYFSRLGAVQNYSAVTGACLLTRSDVFAEAGGLNDTDLAVAFNDVDYCLRLRERGYLVTWTPHAELYHLESVSRGDDMARDKILRFRAEEAYLARRWTDALAHDPYYNPNLSNWEGLFELGEDVRVKRPWRS
jgi:GT2 family glycosyltransferase